VPFGVGLGGGVVDDDAGLVIHAIGGVGKSTLAAEIGALTEMTGP
jgi:predicted protein tyrosine phosphatase